MLIARWESRGGKYWVELNCVVNNHTDVEALTEVITRQFYYNCDNGGGWLVADDKDHAIAQLQARIDTGEFQADANTTPMRRTV